MSVLIFRRGPHLPLTFLFLCSPGGRRRVQKKMKVKRRVSLCLIAPPQVAAGYRTNSSFRRRTSFRNSCAISKHKPKYTLIFRASFALFLLGILGKVSVCFLCEDYYRVHFISPANRETQSTSSSKKSNKAPKMSHRA